jgi:hypothetical protein
MITARQRLVAHLRAAGLSTARADANLDDHAAEELAKAHARVAALPTANDGQLIAATREQILAAVLDGGAR